MVEPIQRQRTVFPSTSGPNIFDVADPATATKSEHIRQDVVIKAAIHEILKGVPGKV